MSPISMPLRRQLQNHATSYLWPRGRAHTYFGGMKVIIRNQARAGHKKSRNRFPGSGMAKPWPTWALARASPHLALASKMIRACT